VPLPRELGWAQVLLWVQFALTVLYVVTVLSVVTYYSGEIFGILVYDSLPSVAGVYLARRLWRGGVWTSRALIAVQAWIVWLSFGTLMHGDLRGVTQAAMPVAVIVLLRRARSREWFETAPQDREERRAFSLARMIRWRRDEGQTAVEYAGLIAVVAAIIVALSVGGLGGRIADGIQSAVCSVTGMACPASQGDGTETGAAEGDDGTQKGGSDADTGVGPGGDAHADGGVHADGGTGTDGGDGADGSGTGTSAGAGSDGQEGTAADAGTDTGDGTGGTNGGSPASAQIITYDGAGANDTVPLAPGPFEQRSLWDDVHDQERHDRTFMDHVRGFFVAPTKSFLASTMDVVSDPVGSIKDTWNGLKGYTTNWWGDKADELGKEWDKGNYVSSVWGWVNSPEDFASDLAIDTFVDKENWEKGNYGASIGNTVVNVIGIFSPKTITKFTKFKKLAEVGESLDKAADAAEKARNAAKAGDFAGAKKAADEAQKHADETKKKAEENGSCTIAIGRVPYGGGSSLRGVSGTGTGVLAAPQAGRIVVAEGGGKECTGDDAEDARQAQQEALDARAEAAKAALRERGSSVPDDQIDGLVNRAKDPPEPGEISMKDAADSLDEITDLARRGNVNGDAAAALEGKVANASDANKLAQARAEVNAVRRAADDAAPGTHVDAGVGGKMNRKEADLGNGEKVNLDEIPDADVVYKDKNGTVHVKEVKNAGSATRKADFANQVERLKEWASKEPRRKATVEIETADRWTSVFSEFKPARNGKPASDTRTAAGEMAKNGVDVKVAGQGLSADQLGRMQRAIDERTANGTMDWRKMKDPDSAKAYLGIE
jgi:Flp pilus assembly pilin Flp